jgi:hypothetical protein
MLHSDGQYDKAEELELQVVGITQRVLGNEDAI